MGFVQIKSESNYYTAQDYFEIDDNTPEQKFEYFWGKLTAMTGTTTTHNIIAGNMLIAIANQISNKCRLFMSDVRLEVKKNAIYFYPDLILTCDAEDIKNKKSISNPCLVVEVLSPSTEAKDLNEKLDSYTKIPSVMYYIVVGQTPFSVKVYERANDFWKFVLYTQAEDIIPLPLLELSLKMTDIYRNIEIEIKDVESEME